MGARQEQKAITTARRLDDRQRAILRALWDHQVLLTAQIKILFFSSERRCQDQMRKLAEMALVEKDNPSQSIGVGRSQAQWTLTENGVQVVAVTMRKPRSALDRMPRHTWHRGDKMLEHRLGVNRFFVSLVEASLLFPDHGLQRWAPEKYHSTMVAGAWIKPDGFGVYQHAGGACHFYLEYDRATEWSRQLKDKLTRYLKVALVWAEGELHHFPNLLVVVPTERREAAFDKALSGVIEELELADTVAVQLPLFIASEQLLAVRGVLGRVWRQFLPAPKDRPLAAQLLAERLSLVELPVKDPGPYDLSKCLGRRWTDSGGTKRRHPAPATYPSGKPPPDPEPLRLASREPGGAPGGGEAA
jgi:hypothetical protein